MKGMVLKLHKDKMISDFKWKRQARYMPTKAKQTDAIET